MKAYLSRKLDDKKVKCLACAHGCIIQNGKVGLCSIRRNQDGSLYLDAYGSAASFGVDIIEKKPLYHFLPGTKTFSFGTFGCNFKCEFCQNHEISMPKKNFYKENLPPEKAVNLALSTSCNSISYTYTEPAVFAEYALDTAKLAKKAGLKNILVTNGFFSKESLKEFSKYIDAVNIDLKSFNDEFYKKRCKAKLNPVLDSIKFFHEKNIWIEVTTLVIPGLNDSKQELRSIANFIASIDNNIPWHISRFFPMNKLLDKEITPLEKLEEAKKIGEEEGLKYVYKGNIPEPSITKCRRCKETLIERNAFKTIINLKNDKCICGEEIRGVF